MRIAVFSDPHINLDEGRLKLFTDCVRNMDADIAVACGDLSNSGRREELDALYSAFRGVKPALRLYAVPGNMDGADTPAGAKRFISAYEAYSGEGIAATYFCREFADCLILGLCAERDDDLEPVSEAQLALLGDGLRRAAERGVPALVFGHYVINNTIDVGWPFAFWGPQSEVFVELFKKYGGRVVYFSGHIHRGLIRSPGGSVAEREGLSFVSVPSLCMPDSEHYVADSADPGTGYIAEVGGGAIRLQAYDFLNNTPIDGYSWSL